MNQSRTAANRHFGGRWILWIALLAAVTAVVSVGSARAGTGGGAEPGQRPTFERQSIAWHACATGPDDETGAALAAAGAQCGEIRAPLDYRDPGGRTITVALARRVATDTAHRLGTLIVNTGGPGPSRDGVTAIAVGLPGLSPRGAPNVAARYDLVGIDPRFFGLSTPLECGWPTNLALRARQFAAPDQRSFEASVANAKELAARCTPYGDRLPFASTRHIARDMDLVRAALNEPRISYLGWSYGTYLGAVYLQMFPDRVDRIVLDSALDPGIYGPGLTRPLGVADAAALEDWAAWAAQRNRQYGLGATTEAVLAGVERIYAAARRRPLQVGSHQVEGSEIAGLLLTVEDTDAAYAGFSAKVRNLRDAANGVSVTPSSDLDQTLALYASTDVLAELGMSATTANQCAERPASRDPKTYWRDIREHLATEPLYGPLFRNITPCAFWPTNPIEAATTVDNNHPALIVSAGGDPVAAYSEQLAMHAALHGSRMLTLAGAFRHGVYLADGNACVDTAVERYLLDGVLPAGDRTCTRS
ncbi:alpha/beta fold hydrolase [Dactylosporangium sp. CA-233914]|uniref:alpha/beta fold hydrolase n=1 Tax=Dactylosporangium sp. CA-233914 TaxID=3239934 RepID=UPI003D91C2D1